MVLGTVARQSTNYTSAGRAISSGLMSPRTVVTGADAASMAAVRRTIIQDPRTYVRLVVRQPDNFAPVLRVMPESDLTNFYRALSPEDQTRFLRGLGDSGDPDLTRIARSLGTPDAAAARAADPGAAATAGAAAGRGTPAARKSALTAANATRLIAVGAVVGTGVWLENKFRKEDQKIKDCIKICLPENWDEHKFGGLKRKDLKYRELDDVGDNPMCSDAIKDCGDYCSSKCKDLHKTDIPGTNLVNRVFEDAGKGLKNLLNALGLDSNIGKIISGVSIAGIVVVIVMKILPMMRTTKGGGGGGRGRGA